MQKSPSLKSFFLDQRVAILGLGGIGKTQIALEFAYRLRERLPFCSVFWIPVGNVNSALEVFLKVGQQLQIPDLEQYDKADVEKLVQHHLSEEAFGEWLLIFDDADDLGVWMDRADDAGTLSTQIHLPESKHGFLLFTTRNQGAAADLAGSNVFSLGKMDQSTARDLFERSLSDKSLLVDDASSADLLQRLAYHPLAIVQAAAFISESAISVAEYTALLDIKKQGQSGRLHELSEKACMEPVSPAFPAPGSFRLNIFELVSRWRRKEIPLSLLPPTPVQSQALDALETLKAYRCTTKHTKVPLLDIHPLVHLSIRNRLCSEGTLAEWQVKVLKRLEDVLPDNKYGNRDIYKMYLPHARYALESRVDASVESHKTGLLWKYGNCAYSDGRYEEAGKAFAQVMQTRTRVLGVEHPSTLTSMGNLAATYRIQGRFKEAEELEMRVFEMLGANHSFTISSMSNLAAMYKDQDQWKKAKELDVQVLNTTEQVLDTENSFMVTRMSNLAATYKNQGLLRVRLQHIEKMVRLRRDTKKAANSKDIESDEKTIRWHCELEDRLKECEAQISELKSQNSVLEGLRRVQDEQLRRLEDLFESRFSLPAEQNSTFPPHADVPSAIGVQTNSAYMSPAARSLGNGWIRARAMTLWEFGQKLLRPRLNSGYRRLEWRCTCGELLYGDFRETVPGSLDNLEARLREHSREPSQQGPSPPPQAPGKAYSRRASCVGWAIPGGSRRSDPTDPNNQTAGGGPANPGGGQQQTLQLCVETGKFTLELSEIDLNPARSDGLLFKKIRERYERARHSIFPLRARSRKPEIAIFIKFRLGKRPFVSPITGTIDTPSIPSEEEVKAGNYIYDPCPIDEPPIDSRTFFHLFYAPASKHPDMMWGQRLPRKLGPGLGPMAQGWGIQLEEHPDWPLFAALMFVLLLFSGMVGGIYSWRTGDSQVGVAIGAWLTTVQAMGMTAFFFWRT